jgi:hypothetical protein
MKREQPTGYTYPLPAWEKFCDWADAKAVPAESEDWEYLWQCYLEGYVSGRLDAGVTH